ncbi:MAG: energy-coupling factor transporter ATPase [Eubacteriales bacterium]
MMKDELIKIQGLCFAYGSESCSEELAAIRNVHITIRTGEYVAIIGHNGSGKSTLAKLLNLILIPNGGQMSIDGHTIDADKLADKSATLTDDEVFEVRKRIGMVFQNPDNQLVANVVEEDVAFGPENLGLPSEEIRRRVDEALDTVDMRAYALHAPHKLSGGQKQRVAIAGVLAMKPRCVIFDESTAMLDPKGRGEILDTMERLNRVEGMTVLHITHHMSEAVRAGRVIVLNDGEVYMDGTPKEVFGRVEALRAIGLEVPQGTELLHRLSGRGYELPGGCLSPEECAEALQELIEKERKNGADKE